MDGILFESLLDVVPIAHEVVFLVLLWLISRWTLLPVVSDCLSSLIELNVLLNPKVGATVPVFQPIDALSLDDQANNDTCECGIVVEAVASIWSHVFVDTNEEHPKREVVNLFNCLWIRLLHANGVQKRCWVAANDHGNDSHELKMPYGPPDLEE